MKLPISDRLICCASMIPPGARVADIGTDHGYLGIYLLQNGICPHVLAADLRQQPLEKARANAALFGVSDRMDFVLSDGLREISPDAADTVVCAGMGGDLIALILTACAWIKDEKYTLILQPQSGGQDLRRWLGENGFSMEAETLVRDGGFLYTVMRVRYGTGMALTPGQQYVSPRLLESGSELLPAYLDRICTALRKTVAGLQRAAEPDSEKLRYYEKARDEVEEMRKRYVNH